MWNAIACPECGCLRSFHSKSKGAEQPKAGAAQGAPLDVDLFYGELEEFLARVRTKAGAAENEDIRKQMEDIYSRKEPLRVALAEVEANIRKRKVELDALNRQTHQQRTNEAARELLPWERRPARHGITAESELRSSV